MCFFIVVIISVRLGGRWILHEMNNESFILQQNVFGRVVGTAFKNIDGE